MSDAVYRPLFYELSDDLFAIAKGIVEAALHKAQPRARYSRPSNAYLFNALFDSSAGQLVCEQYGWKSATMYREAADRTTVLVAKLACGHPVEVRFSDNVAETEPRIASLLESLGIRAQDARRCYCVQREAA